MKNLPDLLNSTAGVSGDVFGKIIQHVIIHGGIERNKENLVRGEKIQETLQKCKTTYKWGDGKYGLHEVNHPAVATFIKEN
jgi:hypothetical protein